MTRGIGYLLAVFLLAMAALAAPAQAATIAVTGAADDLAENAACSLREAIGNINAGAEDYHDCVATGDNYGTNDAITIPAGTYTLGIASTNENLNANGDLDITTNVAITGAGASTTTINGAAIDRVFHITGAFTVSFSGVTITGGYTASDGGGINNNGGALTVANSTISANEANVNDIESRGGGVYSIGGSVSVTSSTISGNDAGGNGGGVWNSGALTIANSTISGNSAAQGGGGIISFGAGSSLDITNSTISGNTAPDGAGGGIFHSDGQADITGTTIRGNTANSDNDADGGGGGGVMNYGAMAITNSTISGNTSNACAECKGGGIGNDTGALTLTGVTIARNSADNGGDGLWHNAGSVTAENTLIADNTDEDCSIVGALTDNGGNLDSDGSCSTFTADAAMVQGTGFAALASNGGSTQTHALLAGSAAVDAAPDCAGLNDDQRGYARPQNGTCDIGAYEARHYTVTVTKSGSGSVADTNTVTGFNISCGATCSDTVVEKTSVTLTASAGSGYYFSGWSGACSGTGNCSLSNITANKNVTATFTANPSSPSPSPEPTPEPEPTDDGGDDTVTPPDPTEDSPTEPGSTDNGAPQAPEANQPPDGGTSDNTTVTFEWETPEDTHLVGSYLYVCESADFTGCETPAASQDGSAARMALGALGAAFLFGFVAPFAGRLRMAPLLLAAFLLTFGAALGACGSSETSTTASMPMQTAQTTLTLQPATTYYWKVMDLYTDGGVMVSETRSFTTPAQ